jgi:thioredoxin-related protein
VDGWIDDYEEALETAKKENKLILADFTGSDWCGWCVKLRQEVFDTPEFRDWASKNVVLLDVDFPRRKPLPEEIRQQNDGLARKYGILGYPTILFLDANSNVVGKMGYEEGGALPWIRKAQRIVEARKAA